MFNKKIQITKEMAEKVWKTFENNCFIRLIYPNFDDYWNECEKINNLPEKEWIKYVNNQINNIKKISKKIK